MTSRLFALAFLALAACGGNTKDTSDSSTSTTDTDPTTATGTTATGTPTGTDTTPPTTDVTVPDPVGDPATVELAGTCPLETRYGGFVTYIYDLYSIVDGAIADGVVPITVFENVGTDGDCELLKRNNPFCDPSCGPTETCDFDGTCIPFPLNQDLGTVTVGGLEDELVLNPIQPGNGYFDTTLTHPVFLPGELIEVRTGGGAFEPVTLHGVGVEPIVLTEEDWVIDQNADMTFHWTPPTAPVSRSHVHVRLNIDQHGNTPIQLFCEFDDDGEGTLPQSLIAALVGAGVTGFPNATVTRRTVDSVTIGDGCAEFIVGSPTDPDVTVAGFTPCNQDSDCPSGQTCDTLNQICE